MVSPRRFSSGQHRGNTARWGATPLQPFANARLLLHQNTIPGDTTSATVASHVLECFLERANYISSKENGPGVDTGDFTYNGFICRSARLPPNPGAIWLSSDLVWQQHGRRAVSEAFSCGIDWTLRRSSPAPRLKPRHTSMCGERRWRERKDPAARFSRQPNPPARRCPRS